MKKPKKIRKYETDGYIFNTFKELKKLRIFQHVNKNEENML